jgi:hypothetical protein
MIGVRLQRHGGVLQEDERMNLQWKTLMGLYDPYPYRFAPAQASRRWASTLLRQKLAALLNIIWINIQQTSPPDKFLLVA